MNEPFILVSGGSGFLGRALVQALLAEGYKVVVWTRRPEQFPLNNSQKLLLTRHLSELDVNNCRAVVNLAGAGIFDWFWTTGRRRILRNSRIDLTFSLVEWMDSGQNVPEVLLSGSAIGIYGDTGNEEVSESCRINPQGFAQVLCFDWEQAALRIQSKGTRVCLLRTGLVLGRGGGFLSRLLPLFKLGLGGRTGSGQQWMSWIHIEDWVAAVMYLLKAAEAQGAYNLTAPQACRNEDFSAQLARLLRRPRLLPMPAGILSAALGEMATLLLENQRITPERLLASGFGFKYSKLDAALRQILDLPRDAE